MSEEKNTSIVMARQGESIYSSMERFESAQRMAKSLSASTFVPEAYRNNIPNTLIAIEVAGRYGNLSNAPSVLAVMQNLYVVHGKPAFEAKFVIGLVNTCGKFSPLRWEFSGEPWERNWSCQAIARDLKTDEELTGPWISMQMAESEGWLDKKGSKWQTMPEQMLRYRSASFWIKVFAPELLLGMHMSDEIEDIAVEKAEIVEENKDSLEALADKLSDETSQEKLEF